MTLQTGSLFPLLLLNRAGALAPVKTMAVIYLRHPKHGAKVAISEVEARLDIDNGWEEFDPTVSNSEPDDDETQYVRPINELQPRRRGRPAREIAQ